MARGSVVLTLAGNTPGYVLTMLACLRLGAAMLPCSEQLRQKDVALRAGPGPAGAGRRASPQRRGRRAAVVPGDVRCGRRHLAPRRTPPPFAELDPLDPAFVLFTSGTSGAPKLVTHAQRYLTGQHLQATEWMAAEPGELVWSTAAPGWSKATRNGFVAPWACGAVALLQDERFDPARRLATIRGRGRERPVHGADGVPADRGGRPDRRAAVAAPRDHRRRGARRACVRGVA